MVNQPLTAFQISAVGYSHQKSGAPCQDHSAALQTGDRTIITACDGHGGSLYIRSEWGSRFASEAVVRVFGAIREDDPISQEKLRMELLCEWNAQIERDLAERPFREEELEKLSDEQRFLLQLNPYLAYGSTLHGAMVLGDRLICASIGDGGIFAFHGEDVFAISESEEDEAVANVTHSLCEERAGEHLKIEVVDFSELDGVLACTDGTMNPYRSMENFARSFVLPAVAEVKAGKTQQLKDFMVRLGAQIGIGDDVTLSMILKPEASKKPGKTPV